MTSQRDASVECDEVVEVENDDGKFCASSHAASSINILNPTDSRQSCSAEVIMIPRLHDTTGCETGCQTGLYNRFDNRVERTATVR